MPSPARPRRRRRALAPRTHRVLLITHALCGASWLGAAIAGVMVLALVMTEESVVGAARAIRFIDLFLYIPLDVATLVTGLIFSIKTHWGFLKHGWVLLKYAINLTILVTAGVILSPVLITLDILATEHGSAAWHLAEFQSARSLFLGMNASYCVLLGIAVALPLLKPRIPVPLQGPVHTLTVDAVRPETHDSATISFRVPFGLGRRYRYAAGQYVTLHVPIDGAIHKRSYSLSSSPGDRLLAVTVKRFPGGLVSNHLLDTVSTGSRLLVEQPRGRFARDLDPTEGRTTYLIAAGSGIAPLVSIARSLLAGGPDNVIHLLDGNRTPADVILADEIDALATDPRVHVTHVFSRLPPDDPAPGPQGRIDARLLAAYLREHPAPADATFLVCGPDAMIDGVVTALASLGIDGDRVHREYFAATAPVRTPDPVTLTAYLDGEEIVVPTDADTIVTEALERAGWTPPTTCREGTCSTCVAQVVEGRASMRRNEALRPDEVAEGLLLTCQGLPSTARLTVDYDAVR